MEKYKCYYTYTDDNGSCVVEGEYYKATDVAELARKALEGIDDYWCTLPENQAFMAELEALAGEGEKNQSYGSKLVTRLEALGEEG